TATWSWPGSGAAVTRGATAAATGVEAGGAGTVVAGESGTGVARLDGVGLASRGATRTLVGEDGARGGADSLGAFAAATRGAAESRGAARGVGAAAGSVGTAATVGSTDGGRRRACPPTTSTPPATARTGMTSSHGCIAALRRGTGRGTMGGVATVGAPSVGACRAGGGTGATRRAGGR